MASSSFRVGQRISYDGALCTVRYIGQVAGTTGSWLGVEWDDPARGKHNGHHKGVSYFACISNSPIAASFARPTRPADSPQTFIPALRQKYASEYTYQDGRRVYSEIIFFGKVAEEVGFDKIQRKQSQLEDLTVVILDDMLIAHARGHDDEPGCITKTCPKIVRLDLSRNLFEDLGSVLEVCRELPSLQHLAINGNRFQGVLEDKALKEYGAALRGVKELALGHTLLGWDELCHIASKCVSLTTLEVGSNQLPRLPIINYQGLTSTLTSVNLEFNSFTSIADVGSLTALASLRYLYLKGNTISTLAPEDEEPPTFPPSLQYLDLSYNDVQSWTFIDLLPKHFPGLTGLRLSHNRVYDMLDATDAKASSSEESYMLTVARIANLKSLNLSQITVNDRANAEMFYLSRIGKQLATVPESAEDTITVQHPRYADLCAVHGEPAVIRRQEVNPSYLESRLVTVDFYHQDQGSKTAKIPKAFDVYTVKGIAGKLFSLSPLKLDLVWETGEWDPVAGFDDQDGDDSDESNDEESEEMAKRRKEEEETNTTATDKPGRWVKREVELKDGPRQLGYCVDGLDVKIRVEPR